MTPYFSGIFEPFSGGLGLGITILSIVIGFLSLFFGRKFYWLFVGVVGFLLGLLIAPVLFTNLDPAWHPWISLFVGVVFAILALFLNKFMIALGGAIGLGTFAYLILAQTGMAQWGVVILSIVSALIGFIIPWLLFDWGLIIFSSLAGASIIASGIDSLIPSVASADLVILLALFIIGLIYQIVVWSRTRVKEEVVEEEVVVDGDDEKE